MGHSFICCIVNIGDSIKVRRIAAKYGINRCLISNGKGTAHSKILDFLKINEIRREIITMFVENELVHDAMQGICREMAFDKPHHGIAYTYPVGEYIIGSTTDNSDSEVKDSMYKAIHVIVDRGRAEEVIEAAKKAGARGGTIVNARGAGSHAPHKLFSIEIEPEKEKVIILASKDHKDNIVTAINEHLNISKPNSGIIYVLDIAEVYGLR